MNIKLIGAVLVMLGCGGVGFSMAAAHRAEVISMRQFIRLLDYISCELQYHLTPLPQLFRQAALESSSAIRAVCIAFAQELEDQISPNVYNCMHCAIHNCGNIPASTKDSLEELGRSLGRFDIQGQLNALESVRQSSRKRLDELEENRDVRLRSYQTLGICAGAALVILLI